MRGASIALYPDAPYATAPNVTGIWTSHCSTPARQKRQNLVAAQSDQQSHEQSPLLHWASVVLSYDTVFQRRLGEITTAETHYGDLVIQITLVKICGSFNSTSGITHMHKFCSPPSKGAGRNLIQNVMYPWRNSTRKHFVHAGATHKSMLTFLDGSGLEGEHSFIVLATMSYPK